MTHWLRFTHGGRQGFGKLQGEVIQVHSGDMFSGATASGETLPLPSVTLLTPAAPSQFIALWNNYHALAAKQGNAIPAEPLYFLKAPSSYLAHGQAIRVPTHYDGKVVYEGELGIVIGRAACAVAEADAGEHIFGYTCVNDVTALDLLNRDASFTQWTRAKSFDTFGVFGPVIATGLDPADLVVRTVVNGRERQNYPCADMIFSPRALVSRISLDMTLLPGDIIACGTSVGVGVLKPGSDVEIDIDGIGTLRNSYGQPSI